MALAYRQGVRDYGHLPNITSAGAKPRSDGLPYPSATQRGGDPLSRDPFKRASRGGSAPPK